MVIAAVVIIGLIILPVLGALRAHEDSPSLYTVRLGLYPNPNPNP